MKKFTILPLFSIVFLLFSCGTDEPKKVSESPKEKATQIKEEVQKEVEEVVEEEVIEEVSGTLSNVGVGAIKELVFDEDIDEALAEKGKKLYKDKGCTACHNATMRLIGPAPQGIYETRNPAWVMNMILDPERMVKEDPDAKALLEEYNNVPMTNQNVSEEEARAMLEYFRTI